MSFENIIIGHASRIDWVKKFKEHFGRMSEDEQNTLIEALRKALRPDHNCPRCGFPMLFVQDMEDDGTIYSRSQWACDTEGCEVSSIQVTIRKEK